MSSYIIGNVILSCILATASVVFFVVGVKRKEILLCLVGVLLFAMVLLLLGTLGSDSSFDSERNTCWQLCYDEGKLMHKLLSNYNVFTGKYYCHCELPIDEQVVAEVVMVE